MEDKPLDLSKKKATSTRESQVPSSDKQQEREKEEKQRTSNKRIFPQEYGISKSGEKNRRANEQVNVKSVPFHHRKSANETKVFQDIIPGNRVTTKRKITTGPDINSGAKRPEDVESPSNPDNEDKPRVLGYPDYSDKATIYYTCYNPSTSEGPRCSLPFSSIEGIEHSGMQTGERPTDRKMKDMPRTADVSDYSERAPYEISSRPSTSATASCSYDSAEVHGHSPIIHNRTHTVDTHVGSKPFACHLCGKWYSSEYGLVKHNRLLHTGERLLKCDYCNRRFVCKSELISHKRVHTGERPFKCDNCGKSFTTKGNLKEHTRVHTNERPFVCQVCNKSFKATSNLNEHMRIHSNKKPHKCIICDKSFSRKFNLNVHAKGHSKEKSYKCLACGRSFSRKANLESHKCTHKRNQTE